MLGELGQPAGLKYLVMQDQPVALAGHGHDPAAGVMIVLADRADQQVVATALCGNFDATVDHVRELQALVLVGEHALAGLHPWPPEDHPDDLLQPGAQRAGGAIRYEPEVGDGLQHRVPGLLPRIAVAVQHPGYRGDRHARRTGHVIDGGWRAEVRLRVGHGTPRAATGPHMSRLVSAYPNEPAIRFQCSGSGLAALR